MKESIKIIQQALKSIPGGPYENLEARRLQQGKRSEWDNFEYQFISKIAQTGITMTKPVSFGICNEGQWVYLLLTWVEGVDLEEVLGNFPVERQYELGRQAGNILRMIPRSQRNYFNWKSMSIHFVA